MWWLYLSYLQGKLKIVHHNETREWSKVIKDREAVRLSKNSSTLHYAWLSILDSIPLHTIRFSVIVTQTNKKPTRLNVNWKTMDRKWSHKFLNSYSRSGKELMIQGHWKKLQFWPRKNRGLNTPGESPCFLPQGKSPPRSSPATFSKWVHHLPYNKPTSPTKHNLLTEGNLQMSSWTLWTHKTEIKASHPQPKGWSKQKTINWSRKFSFGHLWKLPSQNLCPCPCTLWFSAK